MDLAIGHCKVSSS